MAKSKKEPVLVVVQLSGGNDYMNTVIPYNNPFYYDNRPKLKVAENEGLHLDKNISFHPSMKPLQEMHANGDLAIIHGVGWSNSNRSHFRCMDIWHTAEPDAFVNEGWLGKAAKQLDPNSENPATIVNIGQGLPRALVADGVSVASVSDINAYGLLTSVEQDLERERILNHFAQMYAPATGRGPIMEYIARTGTDALKGADEIKKAAQLYQSNIEYNSNTISNRLKDVAKVHLSDIGAKIIYTEYGGFDTHAAQATSHPKLWSDVSSAIADFWDDLRAQDADDNVSMLVFSEFGRRVKENGGGTDHGAAGVSFLIGPNVNGGSYSEYPDIRAEALVEGDLAPSIDFRSVYSSVLDNWMEIDSTQVLNKQFEQIENLF